jgi:MFS family permease
MATVMTERSSFLATRRGKLTLALLCAVGFLDFIDASIVNIALPSIRHDLHFSVQGRQWVLSGYLLTYGGFMLLGGRAGDLLASAAGVFLGGVLTQGPGWRWVLFVNPPICPLLLGAIFLMIPGERRRAPMAHFDVLGAFLATCGMLLLIYALVKAPDQG